ncbi:enhancer of polycomb-like transcription factor protein [Striga asiatica]|uniref:Enhancer of polycomb-like protein n=1 Tax=Striga asiatica TaxID=4170 RepID=A0A5A7RBM9_STRAF|nr:enhancer of polycomb-like transcription factor protein [Striga asiatica]
MPSVGMRRSTRVFGARVLRSGRRLWTKSQEDSKKVRVSHGEDQWAELLEDSADVVEGADDVCKEAKQENKTSGLGDVEMEELSPEYGDVEVKSADRLYGIVYTRKRKRAELDLNEDRRCGKKFFRKQWRKRSKVAVSETCGVERSSVIGFRELAIIANGPACRYGFWITCFLATVLSYMLRVRMGVRRLSAFLLYKPIFDAYTSGGVLFLQDSSNTKRPVICLISGSKSLIPTFSVNISAIPSFFMHMQTSMCIRSEHSACFLVAHSVSIYEKEEKVMDMADYSETHSVAHSVNSYCEKNEEVTNVDDYCEIQSTEFPSYVEQQDSMEVVVPQAVSGRKEFSRTANVGISKSSLRTLQSRNSRHIQKRRSSLRRKKSQVPSGFRTQKSFGTLTADFLRIRQESAKVSPAKSSPMAKNFRELKCTITQDVFITGCCVNLLITEPDKCFREEGANITLEFSTSKNWFLAVKKDGKKKYSLTAEKVMRPSWTNRFSHATIWAVDSSSKFEFPNKHDWLIFKELYKECYERNMLSPATSVIPVPAVQEVLDTNKNYKPYVRPASYIRVRDDELARALARSSAIYDMDSDDEEWLADFNDELCRGEEVVELVTSESFESIIDALEKGFHCNPDNNLDERGVLCDSCMHLERKEVVEAIHGYWVKKRKQKRASLVKIFQLYQPRRIQVNTKSVSRKKRSFKRQASQIGRGKQRPTFPVIATEQNTLEQQNRVQKLQEAKAAAGRSEGLAILKRQKAQLLMANADLASYKAFMALRIAEAAQIAKNPENNLSSLLVEL